METNLTKKEIRLRVELAIGLTQIVDDLLGELGGKLLVESNGSPVVFKDYHKIFTEINDRALSDADTAVERIKKAIPWYDKLPESGSEMEIINSLTATHEKISEFTQQLTK